MLASAARHVLRASALQSSRLSSRTVTMAGRRMMSDSAPTGAYPDPKPAAAAVPPAAASAAAGSSDRAADFSEASSSQQPPPFKDSDLDPSPRALMFGRVMGVIVGVVAAVQLVTFMARRQRTAEEAAQKRTEALNGPAPGAPTVPTLDYRTNDMSYIFRSVLAPLEEFDRRAEDFTERKAVAEARVGELARRRKLGPVDAKEAKQTEVMATRIAAEERTVFAPRLEYIRELYRVRSLELMQRSQYNGERLVASRSGDAQPTEADKALAQEVQAEQAAFQKIARENQHLAAIAAKFGLRGPTSAARVMQPTTEGGAA